MTTRSPARSSTGTGTSAPATRLVQVGAGLSVLALLWQFATAGQIVSGTDIVEAHGGGAIALHISTGLLLVGTVLHARATGVRWPAVLAAVTFVATFVQAALGSAGNMAAHVPGALFVTGGVVWLAVWAFRRSADRG